MFPTQHAILGAIFAFLLHLLYPPFSVLGLTLLFLASFLIDVDHYLLYVIERRDISLRKAYFWCRDLGLTYESLTPKQLKTARIPICFFHTFESTIILFILSFFSEFLFFIFLGFIFHLLVDYTYALIIAINSSKEVTYYHPFLLSYNLFGKTTKELKNLDEFRTKNRAR